MKNVIQIPLPHMSTTIISQQKKSAYEDLFIDSMTTVW